MSADDLALAVLAATAITWTALALACLRADRRDARQKRDRAIARCVACRHERLAHRNGVCEDCIEGDVQCMPHGFVE